MLFHLSVLKISVNWCYDDKSENRVMGDYLLFAFWFCVLWFIFVAWV